MTTLSRFSSRLKKMLLIFTYENEKCYKFHFIKVTLSHLPGFLTIAQQKKKKILLGNLVCVLSV